MKILHIWNIAGQGGLLARGMDELYGTESFCLHRKMMDKFDLIVHGRAPDISAKRFYLEALIKSFRPDVLHIHTLDRFLRILKWIFPKKPMVLHYHGSQIRGKWDDREKYWKKADIILVSTEDLLEGAPEDTVHLPRIVDEKMISELVCDAETYWRRSKRIAYHVDRYASDLAKKYAEDRGLNVTIQIRDNIKYPHRKFLRIMNDFFVYIDVKRDCPSGSVIKELSLTGLEALKMGLGIINWNGDWIEKFPMMNETNYVVDNLYDIYEELLDG